MALAIFFLGFVGLGVSLYPYIVPRAVTIWQAAAPAQSQVFMLVGVIIILPMILAYTGWAYWVFRGKVGTHGYHSWHRRRPSGRGSVGWRRSGRRAYEGGVGRVGKGGGKTVK